MSSAADSRRYRRRQRDKKLNGAVIVHVRLAGDDIDALVEAGLLAAWDAHDLDAIEAALQKAVVAVTRDGDD